MYIWGGEQAELSTGGNVCLFLFISTQMKFGQLYQQNGPPPFAGLPEKLLKTTTTTTIDMTIKPRRRVDRSLLESTDDTHCKRGHAMPTTSPCRSLDHRNGPMKQHIRNSVSFVVVVGFYLAILWLHGLGNHSQLQVEPFLPSTMSADHFYLPPVQPPPVRVWAQRKPVYLPRRL